MRQGILALGYRVNQKSVVGRDQELAALAGLLDSRPGDRSVLLVGEPGIGKTTLWEAVVDLARTRGMRVLRARPGGSEAQVPFAGLIDVCDTVDEAELARLPAPQREALEVALLRAEAGDEPVSSTAVALGLLGIARGLVGRDSVLVAIDDLQWLDVASADALAFVARRLEDAELRFLLARRPGRPGVLERVVARGELERIQVGPLSLGAVRRLLFERLGLTVSRQLLRRIMEATEGNPLFALEVGRSLVERGIPSLDEEVPLPESLEEILTGRVSRLPPSVRRVLVAVALSEDLQVDQVMEIGGELTLAEAIDAGVLVVDGRRVRASHPLLAAAAERRSGAHQRRELHLALAGGAKEEQSRVMHLALATTGEDAKLAKRASALAERARARGARRQARLLAGHALRLTPHGAPERPARVLALAAILDDAGELGQLADLLERELDSLPPGPSRAHAWILLGETDRTHSMSELDQYLERALAECRGDRDLRAVVLAKRASNAAAGTIRSIPQAEAWAQAALRDARQASTKRFALYALAWTRALAGQPVDDLCARSAVAADPASYISASPERVAGKRLLWRGDLDGARAQFGSLSALADERGELISYAMVRLHLCELELRAGGWDAVVRLLDEWEQSSDYEAQFRPQYQRCRALLAAVRGDVEGAERWATDGIERASAVGCLWDELEARRARGLAALLAQDPARAARELRLVWAHCEREGVRDPGAFPVGPELVEALVELGELAQASAIVARLHSLAGEQDHPWARASAERGEAQLDLAAGPYQQSAAAKAYRASAELERLGLRFDSACCLLSLGRAQRRLKQWRATRETLDRAARGFEALGSGGWADRAHAELRRVGGRRGATGELTASERRVVELAAEGLANKEIAAALYVTVNTVEVHLRRAYAKLGVRSRAQLARRLAAHG